MILKRFRQIPHDGRHPCRQEESGSGGNLWTGEVRELCGEFSLAPHGTAFCRTRPDERKEAAFLRLSDEKQAVSGISIA